MFTVLIDTCVWLDMAQEPKQTPLLLLVENMVQQKMLRLVVPEVVIEEFRRNRARVAQASTRSLKSHVAQVKEAIKRVDGFTRISSICRTLFPAPQTKLRGPRPHL